MTRSTIFARRVRTIVAAPSLIAVAAYVLVACSDGGAIASSAIAPSASAPTAPTTATSSSMSAAPSPTPNVVAADCSAAGIVPGRLDCLDTNLPVVGNPGESAAMWEADYCSPGEGRFVFVAAPHLVAFAGQHGGEIGRIDVYDPSLTTAEGIHVGSAAADVAAAYPATPSVTSFSGTELVVLSGPEGFITIELANGWGVEPLTVANIRIYAAD